MVHTEVSGEVSVLGRNDQNNEVHARVSRTGYPARRPQVVQEQRLVVTAEAYAAGDAVGGLITLEDLEDSGVFKQGKVIDNAANAVAYELWCFADSGFTATTDGAAFDPDDVELLSLVTILQIANAHAANDNAVVLTGNIADEYWTWDGKLYCQLVTQGTPTYAATADVLAQFRALPD